jgi:hypothetical protein
MNDLHDEAREVMAYWREQDDISQAEGGGNYAEARRTVDLIARLLSDLTAAQREAKLQKAVADMAYLPHQHLVEKVDKLTADLTAARKALEAAEGDAARYRWLKERLVEDCDDYDHYLSTREVFSEDLVKTFSKDRWANFLKRTELDAAIDDARAAQEQQK